jgi:translation initiation factor 4E
MYNNIYTVEEVMPNTDYMLFKKGVRPEWEDPQNRDGGKWVVTLPIEDDMEEECDQAWIKSLVTLVSGQIELMEMQTINGIVLSVREKHLRLSLWCSESKNIACLKSIGRRFKLWCGFHEKFKFKFLLHEKALNHDMDNASFVDI